MLKVKKVNPIYLSIYICTVYIHINNLCEQTSYFKLTTVKI